MSPSTLRLPNLEATSRLASLLAPHLRRGDVMALAGPLGAGKTTFVRALLQSLGITEEVPSPTFTLVQNYMAGNLPIFHFDLYRLKNALELEELGWYDAIHDGLVIVEWPERAASRMPARYLDIKFEIDENDQRRCLIDKHGEWNLSFKGML